MEINEAIRDKEVRLIGADGSQLGIVPVRDALRRAEEANLDLVKIAPQAQPPVCKILDYGKFRFEQQKREKEARKNQKIVDIKEIRLSLNIDTNDFNTKVAQAAKFLAKGDKVKVSIRFRGREMAHTNLGLVKRGHAYRSHLLNGHGKTTKIKRGYRKPAYADKTNTAAVKDMLPYG